MAGRSITGAVAAAVVALVLAAGAAAAQPDPGALTLQAADVPGAKLKSQGSAPEKNYVAGYQRTFAYSAPHGRSGIVFVESRVAVAASAATPTATLAGVRAGLTGAAGRKAVVAEVAKVVGVKTTAVRLGAKRTPRVGDGAIELPVSVQLKGVKVYESVLFMKLDRTMTLLVTAGLRPIAAAETAGLANAIAAHVKAALAPKGVSPPSVAGTPQQGQTLTASPGTWSVTGAATTYQWQKCDAAGATCVDVPGATTQTYVVQPTDVGSTLRVNVTATNRFGSATAASAVTAPVT